jgi:hypothetical protein
VNGGADAEFRAQNVKQAVIRPAQRFGVPARSQGLLGCPLSRGFLHWRLSNAGPAALVRVETSVMGPPSETRDKSRPERVQQWRCEVCHRRP